MSLKRMPTSNARSASSGLRSVQTLHSLAVPALGRGPEILQHVPENQEMDIKNSSSTKPKAIFLSEDWNSLQKVVIRLFNGDDILSTPDLLQGIHQNVKNILRSKTGTFLSDYYKQELLAKGMNVLTERLKNVKAIVCDAAKSNREISSAIRQMLLVLQNVNDCYPPNKNKLQLESILALVINPYLGFLGLYEGETKPLIDSNEPKLASRRRSSVDVNVPRRVSKPFRLQPLQLDTLNQMFLNAIRKREDK